jgi:hypothetical protein
VTKAPFPPVVYVPTVDLADGDPPRLALHPTHDGRTALFVYSALDRLVEFYDAGSPWALLSVADLQAAYERSPYHLVFLDKRPRPDPEVAAS